jgi:hypothetical protein
MFPKLFLLSLVHPQNSRNEAARLKRQQDSPQNQHHAPKRNLVKKKRFQKNYVCKSQS